jgi:hypothetical protein
MLQPRPELLCPHRQHSRLQTGVQKLLRNLGPSPSGRC